MSANETVPMAEPAVDMSMPPEFASPDEAVYSYQRADGTVEYATDMDDAIKRCPVLGRIAIEAPDQVSDLLELAALGSAGPASPRAEQSEVSPKESMPAVQKPKPAPTNVHRVKMPASFESVPEVAAPARGAEVVAAESRAVESATAPAVAVIVAEQLVAYQPRTEAAPAVEISSVVQGTAKQTEALSAHAALPDRPASRPPEPATNETQAPSGLTHRPGSSETSSLLPASLEVPSEATPSEPITIESNEITAAPALQQIAGENLQNFSVVPGSEAVELESDLEPEVVETFAELAEIAGNPDGPIALTEAVNHGEPLPVFEAMVLSQESAAEEAPSLETITATAQEQPLGQTLAQLAVYLKLSNSQSEQAVTPPGSTEKTMQLEEVRAALQAIQSELPACYVVNTQTHEIRQTVTAQMTRQLLALLHAVGYENPREVLVETVRLQGVAYLLQVLHYLALLSSADSQPEFWPFATVATTAADDDSADYFAHHQIGGLGRFCMLRLLVPA